jgi:hypothetical protein
MTFNRAPLRKVTDEDIATYRKDGVVCLRQVFDRDWIDSLLPLTLRLLRDKEEFGLLPTIPGRYMSRTIPAFRRFVFESPLGEVSGQTLGSNEIRFFFDEIFAKGPHSTEKTIWHSDRMGWPVAGAMVPSIWIPLTPIVEANSLECVASSHSDESQYWLFSPNARKMIRPPDRVSPPDVESWRSDPGKTFLRWTMEPGDLLIVHPSTLHYSHGNPTADWRVAISMRVFGDDIRWRPRPDCVNLAGVSFDEMIEGEKPEGPLFPLIWSSDGRCDDDSDFPRGFATRWTRKRDDGVGEYALFQKLLEAEKAASAE